MTRQWTQYLVRSALAVAALVAASQVAMAGGDLDERVANAGGSRWAQVGVVLPGTVPSVHQRGDLGGPSSGGEAPCPQGVDSGWWGKVQRDIAASEYHIGWNENAGAYQSSNRAQNLRFTYGADGFAAEPLRYEGASSFWRLELRLAAWGREDAMQEFQAGDLRVEGTRAEAEGGGITVLYRNDRAGMRQDFLVKERPSGSGPLRVWLRVVQEGVGTEVEANGRGVAFVTAIPGGGRVLTYGDLEVRDARGYELEAFMARDGDGCAIVVADADAVYPVLVDPLSSSPDWTVVGETAGDFFSYSAAPAGDVNGDGYSDVIVGAPGNDGYIGKAYVYLGSATGLSTTASWAVSGEAGDFFGYPVATAGDVNGDGYSDVVVGASGNASSTGKAYVYLGSATGLSTTASWTATGDATDDYFGNSVATAGDVNGDGYSDMLVGAYGNASETGKAYLYLGSATGLSADTSWTKSGEAAENRYGSSLGTAGDVNGDGYSDVVIGAWGNASLTGKAYVYLGSATGLSTTASWTKSEGSGYNFGNSVGTAGDVNGDGYSDVVVGASAAANDIGVAYLYLGSATGLSTTASWMKSGEGQENRFGYPVGTAGDVDGDGYSDVVVGAAGNASDTGKTYLFLGSATGLSTTATWAATGEGPYDYFGNSVTTAGDVDGDGYSDVVVGAFGNDSFTGKASLYLGSASGLSTTASWTKAGEAFESGFGRSMATAGDVNGDGYSDVVVGAPWRQSNTGKAYLYLGSASGLSADTSWTATGEAANNYFGVSVATAGDVNGDGYSDVVVGAYGNASGIGKAYVYLGSATGLSDTASWTTTGEANSGNFGNSVGTAGDVNGDGYSDVVVGAPWGQSNTGKAYVYLGSATGPAAAASWTATGEGTYSHFGCSVGTAGDVNGDGYSDVVVGADGFGVYDTGKAYLYLGSATGLSMTASWTATGETTDNFFGCSVVTAGDVNGDGYSDVVVGAWGNASLMGKAYAYLGSATGLSTTASWTATGEPEGYYFGGSVGTAGDVDGDGYSDVVVGANGYAEYTGRAYLYLGSATGLSAVASWAKPGEGAYSYFGWSVATAGDVDGDGYSDVVVGAPHDQTYTGKAYLYCGNDGGGVHVLPRQWSPDLVTPVIPALKTRSSSQAGLGFLARTFFGRSDVRAQFEIKMLGTPFDGTGLVTTDWADAGTTGATVSEVIGGLSDATMYTWRGRVGYRLSDGAPQPYGRWIYQPYNGGLGEADFRVGDYVPPGAPALHIVPLSPTQCRLWWHPVAGALAYDLYRGTVPYFAPGTPWQTVAVPDTTFDFSEGVGDPGTTYYFLSRTVGTSGESGNSDRVGEHEVALP